MESIPDELYQAGRVARRVKEEVYRLVRPGVNILDLAERVESLIADNNARPAFPCNVGVNEVAAHFTPVTGYSEQLSAKSVVKVDFGVEIDGYIADTAVTVTDEPLGDSMRLAAEEALRAALKVARAGVRVSEIGAAIQGVVSRRGFKPIRNLTGHEIARFNLHAGVSIPNVETTDSYRLQSGHVYAVEPFVTLPDGSGEVEAISDVTIFRVEPLRRPDRGLGGDDHRLLEQIDRMFRGLPYAERWLSSLGAEAMSIHQRLVKMGRIQGYPVLVEKKRMPVAQAEHTILVLTDGLEVLT